MIARGGATTEVHLSPALAGDPVLTSGTGFGLALTVEGAELVASVAGGTPHRTPL